MKIKGITKKEQKILDERIASVIKDDLFLADCRNAKSIIIQEITNQTVRNILHQLFTYIGTRLEYGEISNLDQGRCQEYIWKKIEKVVKKNIRW